MSGNRIPADQLKGCSAWAPPEVKRGQVVQAEKLRERGPRGELLELAADEVVYTSITAQQLGEITEAAYEEVREQAQKEGQEQGFAAGYEAGLAEGRDDLQRQQQTLQQLIGHLTQALSDQDDELEQALVNLATCIASSILRRELKLDSSQIVAVVQEALAALPVNASGITLHVNPQDEEILSQQSFPSSWTIQPDPSLTAGGCRIRTDHSVVNFTLEDQFQQVVSKLVEQRFTQSPEADEDP